MEHEHLSFFELDQIAVSPGEPRDTALLDCPRCAGYLAEVERALPAPTWARELEEAPRSRRRRWFPLFAGALAAAGSLFIYIHRAARVETAEDGIRDKGAPGVVLFVKHQSAVRRWDGKSAVAPDDSLMLEISPARYRQLAVESVSGQGSTVLYQAALESGAKQLLPQSYRVDKSPGAEHLRIRFGSGAESVSIELEIPKESGK